MINQTKSVIAGAIFLVCTCIFMSTIGATAFNSFSAFKASEAKYVANHQMPKLSEAELAPLVCPNYFKYKDTNLEPIRKINAEKTFCEHYPQYRN